MVYNKVYLDKYPACIYIYIYISGCASVIIICEDECLEVLTIVYQCGKYMAGGNTSCNCNMQKKQVNCIIAETAHYYNIGKLLEETPE